MTDWNTAAVKAAKTAKWATTMTKWLIARYKGRTSWQIVSFCGPNGCESAGIVDLLAVRKDHGPRTSKRKRGDLLEIVVIQVKGGNADWPSRDELIRLKKVKRYHRAKHVVLAQWKKGKQPTIYRMKRIPAEGSNMKAAWEGVSKMAEVFGK